MTNETRDGIYAGLLVSAESVQVIFGEKRKGHRGEAPEPLGIYEAVDIARPPPIKIGDDVKSAEEQLRLAVSYVVATCKKDLVGLAIGSYGPIRATSLTARDKELTKQKEPKPKSGKERTLAVYGQVWDNSPHANLRGLRNFHVARDVLGARDFEPRVHSDVVCGAIAESLDRMVRGDESPEMRAGEGIVFFANVSSGVGATFARGGVPWIGTMHSESGFSAVQPLAGDGFAWRRFREAGADPLYLEQLLSVEAILERTGVRPIAGIPLHDQFPALLKESQRVDKKAWETEIPEYLAQLVYLATVMVSPRRVVLYGPVMDAGGDALLGAVRKAFRGWLGKRRPVFYDELDRPETYICKPVSTAPMLRGALLLAALPEQALRVPEPIWQPEAG